MTTRVVLVRPWTDAHGGTGCCSGEPRGSGVCLDRPVAGGHEHDAETALVGATYARLRELPDVDVQVVGAGNTAYLLPSVFRAVRRRRGTFAALREMNRATTAGSVLVDGERVGALTALGIDGAVDAVRRRV